MIRSSSLMIAAICLTAAAPAFAGLATTQPSSEQFIANLAPLNNSGVNGTATLTLTGDQLTVHITASGLEPNQIHPQHIHGFTNGTPSVQPTLAADDKNHNGVLDELEAEVATGGEIVYLTNTPMGNRDTDYPKADAQGRENFTQTYMLGPDFGEPEVVLPLNIRAIELHGMTMDGMYNKDLPVAGGLIMAAGSSGQGTGGTGGSGGTGGTAVPIPAAAIPGLAMLGLLALVRAWRCSVAAR